MTETHLDALVVGAGFGGIHMLRSFLNIGLRCRAVDKYTDLGGTWHANRYPGVMSDSYSHMYRFTADRDDFLDASFTKNYLTRDEIVAYLNHVVDKNSLREHMQLSTEVLSAEWDDAAKRWRVPCSTGDVFVVKYLVTSLGLFGKNKLPDIPGLADGKFKGRVMHSAAWDRNYDIDGKRVGIIGSGSTGIQLTVASASKAKELHCFIRNPQYSVPAGIRDITPNERRKINNSYDDIRRQIYESKTSSGFAEPSRTALSVSREEREQIFEDLWRLGGGFRFLWGGFSDIGLNLEANEEACIFLRKKILQIVRDPVKAKALLPREPYARRPPCDDGYYECFNRDNVHIVDIHAAPITQLEERGIRTADGVLHELDILALATGFEAVDGPYKALQNGIKGRGGKQLTEHWDSVGGASAYMGVFVSDFPNFFIVNGPQVPVANVPTAIEVQANFILDVLREQVAKGNSDTIEITPEIEAQWIASNNNIGAGMVANKVSSWTSGRIVTNGTTQSNGTAESNGKPPHNHFFLPGIKAYVALTKDIKANNYPGFVFS
ncbi:cyclohexanone monooxygenase [Hyaloscypha variabilis]